MSQNGSNSPLGNFHSFTYIMQMPDQSTLIVCRICNQYFSNNIEFVHHFGQSHLQSNTSLSRRLYDRNIGLNQNSLMRSLNPFPSSFSPLAQNQAPATQSDQWVSRWRDLGSRAHPYPTLPSPRISTPPSTANSHMASPSGGVAARPNAEREPFMALPRPVSDDFRATSSAGHTMRYIEQLDHPIIESNVIHVDDENGSNEIDLTLRL